MCKQMDVFVFSQEAQFFLKARCARLEPWHLLPPRSRRQHALTSKQLLTARCAARAFLFAVCAAAVLRAHQLCSWSTSRSKSKERGAWSIGKKSAAALRWLQCKLQPTLWNSTFPPRFFPKEMAIFTPPLAKFSPAARIIDPPLLGGAARPESATLTVTIIHAWSSMVVDVPGVGSIPCACPATQIVTCRTKPNQ